MKICSLFTGIGGIDLGFKQAGFDIVWANEFDHDAATTYRVNFGEAHLVEKDIREVDALDIPDFDVLVAGFPCQPFSVAGLQRGFKDPRGNLFFEISRIIDIKRPSIVFLENVANLMQHDNGKTFLVIYNTLVQFGYVVKYKVLDSQEYGNVPQQRKRIFIVAFLDYEQCKRFSFPEPIERTVELNDVLDRSIKHNDTYYYNEASNYFNKMIRVITDKYGIYQINDKGFLSRKFFVCPTLTATMGIRKDRVPIIKDDYGIRKITPMECLALQGFPKDFVFKGISLNSAYKQCGNSVVVPVVRRIAEKIKESFNKKEKNYGK